MTDVISDGYKDRNDCRGGLRPCTRYRCRHNLVPDIARTHAKQCKDVEEWGVLRIIARLGGLATFMEISEASGHWHNRRAQLRGVLARLESRGSIKRVHLKPMGGKAHQLATWELAETCSLDVADRGGVTLEFVGNLYGVTREMIRQTEGIALRKTKRHDAHENGGRLREAGRDMLDREDTRPVVCRKEHHDRSLGLKMLPFPDRRVRFAIGKGSRA